MRAAGPPAWPWVAAFALLSAGGTLALACAMPFVALAALAATRAPRGAGVSLILLAWGASQAIGFVILGYPRDVTTIAWGGALLSAGLAALALAHWGERAIPAAPAPARLATAFGTAFAGYKLVLLGWSLLLGGLHTAASPYWTLRQFATEAVVLVLLIALHRALALLGMPMPRPALSIRRR